MNSDVLIKPLSEVENKDEVKLLLKGLYDKIPRDTDRNFDFEEYWEQGFAERICLVAVDQSENKVVGVINGILSWAGIQGVGRYNNLVVIEERRKSGIGIELLNRLLEAFRKTEIKLVVGRTWDTNQPAIRLFEKAGFVLFKKLESSRVTGEDTLWYYYELVDGAKNLLLKEVKKHIF